MVFRSRKTWWIGLIFWFSILSAILSLIWVFLKGSMDNIIVNTIPGILIAASAGLLLWIWYGTHYKLTNDCLFYSSGPFKGRIPLEEISKIEAGRTLWVGMRPALATKGLIIHYGRYDKVYISPDDNKRFLTELRKQRPDVQADQKMFR